MAVVVELGRHVELVAGQSGAGQRAAHPLLVAIHLGGVDVRQVPFAYDREQRFAGSTKYPLRKMIRFALDALTGFSSAEALAATDGPCATVTVGPAANSARSSKQLNVRPK